MNRMYTPPTYRWDLDKARRLAEHFQARRVTVHFSLETHTSAAHYKGIEVMRDGQWDQASLSTVLAMTDTCRIVTKLGSLATVEACVLC
jgi:hypothetical protein